MFKFATKAVKVEINLLGLAAVLQVILSWFSS